jgi:hypothetical protein
MARVEGRRCEVGAHTGHHPQALLNPSTEEAVERACHQCMAPAVRIARQARAERAVIMAKNSNRSRDAQSDIAGQAYSHLSLPEQVRLARPLAAALLIEGINFGERKKDATIDRICAMAGVPDPMSLLEDKNDEEHHQVSYIVYTAIDAALALGIALGQCLTPNALNGGAQSITRKREDPDSRRSRRPLASETITGPWSGRLQEQMRETEAELAVLDRVRVFVPHILATTGVIVDRDGGWSEVVELPCTHRTSRT